MNLFQKAGGWLTDQIQVAAGEEVTYIRGAEEATLTATVGRTVFASNAEDAARIIFGDRDYLIAVEDLPYDTPAIGDRISHPDVGVFEIKDTDSGDPPWRHSDPDQTEWRIHVKQVS